MNRETLVMPRQKVRAERRCGELLACVERATPGRPIANTSKPETNYQQALRENEIPHATADRYQQLAAMPAEHFETAVATAKATAGEVTTDFMLREGSPRFNFVRRCDKVCRPCARGLALMGVVSFDSHTPPRAGSPSAECPPTMRGHLSAARAR